MSNQESAWRVVWVYGDGQRRTEVYGSARVLAWLASARHDVRVIVERVSSPSSEAPACARQPGGAAADRIFAWLDSVTDDLGAAGVRVLDRVSDAVWAVARRFDQ
jgi:hypothetical protein